MWGGARGAVPAFTIPRRKRYFLLSTDGEGVSPGWTRPPLFFFFFSFFSLGLAKPNRREEAVEEDEEVEEEEEQPGGRPGPSGPL